MGFDNAPPGLPKIAKNKIQNSFMITNARKITAKVLKNEEFYCCILFSCFPKF